MWAFQCWLVQGWGLGFLFAVGTIGHRLLQLAPREYEYKVNYKERTNEYTIKVKRGT